MKYQRYEEIVKILQEKILSTDCEIIKQGLLHCNETIDKIKNDITPIKCVIPVGKKNEYLEPLNNDLITKLNFLYLKNELSINDYSRDLEYSIKKTSQSDSFEVIFPILVIHYNNYSEFENEKYAIINLIYNCLKKKVAFLFFFNINNTKDWVRLIKK